MGLPMGCMACAACALASCGCARGTALWARPTVPPSMGNNQPGMEVSNHIRAHCLQGSAFDGLDHASRHFKINSHGGFSNMRQRLLSLNFSTQCLQLCRQSPTRGSRIVADTGIHPSGTIWSAFFFPERRVAFQVIHQKLTGLVALPTVGRGDSHQHDLVHGVQHADPVDDARAPEC
jgi:hypothetical protein